MCYQLSYETYSWNQMKSIEFNFPPLHEENEIIWIWYTKSYTYIHTLHSYIHTLYIHTYIHTYMCTYMNIHIHIHIHMHCRLWSNWGFNGIWTHDLRITNAMLYQLSYCFSCFITVMITVLHFTSHCCLPTIYVSVYFYWCADSTPLFLTKPNLYHSTVVICSLAWSSLWG